MMRLELSEQMLAIIAEALGNHRFREAAPVISEIQRQINAQMMNGKDPADADGHDRHRNAAGAS